MGKEETIQEVVEGLSRLRRPIDHSGWRVLGLSRAQVGMLYMLYCHENASVKQVANHLGITQSAVTQLIDPLLQKGLVTKTSDPKDRRIAQLRLAAKGRNLLKKLKKLKSAGLRTGLTNLSAAELEQLSKLVSKMAA